MARQTGLGSFFGGLASGISSGAENLGSSYWRGQEAGKREKTRKAERKELLDIQEKLAQAQKDAKLMDRVTSSLPPRARAGVLKMSAEELKSPGVLGPLVKESWAEEDKRTKKLADDAWDKSSKLRIKLAGMGRGRQLDTLMQRLPFNMATREADDLSRYARDAQRYYDKLVLDSKTLGVEIDPGLIENQGIRARMLNQAAQFVRAARVNKDPSAAREAVFAMFFAENPDKLAEYQSTPFKDYSPRDQAAVSQIERRFGFRFPAPARQSSPATQGSPKMSESSKYGPSFWRQ
tara:strand:+ start:1598 stop:2473 length:876 start_codon:yes stop_codon:yes gene_type:complete